MAVESGLLNSDYQVIHEILYSSFDIIFGYLIVWFDILFTRWFIIYL